MKYALGLGLGLSWLVMAGCTKAPDEAAPLNAGDFLEYQFAEQNGGMYSAKIEFQPSGKEVVVTANPPGAFKPETVDVALLHGRKLMKMYRLGQLWLPTKARVQGAKVAAGDVTGTRTFNQWPVITVVGNAGADKRFYHQETGYLVGMELAGRGNTALRASLTGASFPGMAR